MLKNFWKRLDNTMMPRQTGDDYAEEALALSELEYLKSLDAVDFAETNAEYHRRRIERYKAYASSKKANFIDRTDNKPKYTVSTTEQYPEPRGHAV